VYPFPAFLSLVSSRTVDGSLTVNQNAVASVTTLDTFPSPRTGALLLPSPEPGANHLYLLFGEYFDGSRATFYDSTLRYDIGKEEWREYKSLNGPSPRSSAAGVCVPGLGDGGGILIFGESRCAGALKRIDRVLGGEYASPTQTSFHHYRDLVWVWTRARGPVLNGVVVAIQRENAYLGEDRNQKGSFWKKWSPVSFSSESRSRNLLQQQ